jgi:hypothetical protein
MPRSVNAVASRQRRKKILKAAKGYFGARSKRLYGRQKYAVEKGLVYAYRDRKRQESAHIRRLWIARINAATRAWKACPTPASSTCWSEKEYQPQPESPRRPGDEPPGNLQSGRQRSEVILSCKAAFQPQRRLGR